MQTSLIKSHAYFSSESTSSISFLPSTRLRRTQSIKGNHLDRHKGSCLHPSCYSVTSTSEVILHRSLLIFISFFTIWLRWVLVESREIFSCGMYDLLPGPGIKPGLPAWETHSHWTIR